ncbi:PQQ-binding-like beta-propeller repeat protein [Alteromonas oceani]|uniref:Quinoprotein glucose dehydrogenase n=2 Tax=Alteromonas TaxID=226 RepID=A0A2S9V3P6_9ALTE|nr:MULTISPECIES: PQQ-binding-like beta-propeller repeat protein [Alteromonas]PRO71005.1 quinoprotein glucose dehydrogenase [Alteromonas alba]
MVEVTKASFIFGLLMTALLPTIARGETNAPEASVPWRYYNGDQQGQHFSSLTQINKHNVSQLEIAWQMDITGQGDPQTNPLIIGDKLFGFTPGLTVFAVDATNGKKLWEFNPKLKGSKLPSGKLFTGPSRGLAFYEGKEKSYLVAGVMNYLFAIDKDTGERVSSFGNDGAIDLRKNLGGDYTKHYVSLTTPGVIFNDLYIVGYRTSENPPAPIGNIRAYNLTTGELAWQFRTMPDNTSPHAASWSDPSYANTGGANSWAGMALDEENGIVFVPTGSAVPDFFGGSRLGDNLFANTLLALNARTGEKLWHFQTVHHDIWDRDLPSPPSLLTVRHKGQVRQVVAQPTKQGFLFVFDRLTGEPLFDIKEQAFPPSALEGEVTSPTQPVPVLPEPYARQHLTEALLTDRTPEANAWAKAEFNNMISEGLFVPFTTDQPTVIFPGFDGGAEWGGAAVDPDQGVIFINSNDIAWTGSMVEATQHADKGHNLYAQNCAVCHGEDRSGSPPAFPSLIDIGNKLADHDIKNVIKNGRGRMPQFAGLTKQELTDLTSFLTDEKPPSSEEPAKTGDKVEMVSPFNSAKNARYYFSGYHKFLDPDGYPAVKPPWGTLNAIDVATGQYLWRKPLGEYPELAAAGLTNTGSENYGGAVVTASGLLFIGATIYDRTIRAFDTSDGKILWQAQLPYAGTATPATYMVDGVQYIVISTNNARNPKGQQGAAYVAFKLAN